MSEEKSKEHSEHGKKHHKATHTSHSSINKLTVMLTAVVALLILFNQYQISNVNGLITGSSTGFSIKSATQSLNLLSGKGGVIVGPQLNTDGRTTKLVEWPTISEVPKLSNTGDAVQDALSVVVPIGVPFYVTSGPGSELLEGISFDDPITSQQLWASLTGSKRFKGQQVELSPEEEQRLNKLTGVFTCDYCCGGPNSVTTINKCGCAHSFAWQGMARFFVKYYGDKYTDEQILGEMTRWKGLWYPKGMLQDYLVYTGNAAASTLNHGGSTGIIAQFAGQGGSASASIQDLENLPGMVGGC